MRISNFIHKFQILHLETIMVDFLLFLLKLMDEVSLGLAIVFGPTCKRNCTYVVSSQTPKFIQ